MGEMVLGRALEEWRKSYPLLEKIQDLEPVFWENVKLSKSEDVLPHLELTRQDMEEAEDRWQRFAPLIRVLFPETGKSGGIIESDLKEINSMKQSLVKHYGGITEGRLFIKCDNYLPVAGSIKARGGIYEVLKHAEDLALNEGMISMEDDYSVMASARLKNFFSRYRLAVGSTGNLGMSIGIMGASLGFKVTVHMSADAKEWKKNLLRQRGVEVIEYSSDYSKAVEEGRRQSQADPSSHFVDDENSRDLFLGYSVAALRLKKQLEDLSVDVSEKHPLNVYLPCGVGGAPGGITFGLKHVFGDNAHCYFVEPTHSPCMLLGLMTGEHERVSVGDFGIDNITDADGLAVGRPSGLVGRLLQRLISGVFTVDDDDLYEFLALLKDSEGIKAEPSAAAGFTGPLQLQRFKGNHGGDGTSHIVWATGGLFVPDTQMDAFYKKGKELLSKR